MGFAVSYLRGGCVGVVRLVVFSLRGGGVGVMGLAVLYLRGGRVGVVGLVTSSMRGGRVAGRRACSIVRAQRRSRRWWGRACDVVPTWWLRWSGQACGVLPTRQWRRRNGTRGVVPTWRLCRCDGTRGVVPTRRSCWWGWACDNIVTRCRCAVRVEHSRVTRQWRLGRSWDLRVSRQQNQQEQDRSDCDCSSRLGSFGHNGSLTHRG